MEEEKNEDQKKINKTEENKKKLLNKVLSGNLETKHDKVGFILNNYSQARNSDIELAWLYWSNFENDLFDGFSIKKSELKKLTRMSSLIRSRAKIQNEYKLFQADEKIKKRRGVLAEEMKEQSVADKPKNLPIYSVYIDETGKNQDFLSVGSLWIIDGRNSLKTNLTISDWKNKNEIQYEFHFAEVKKHKLDQYKEFFKKYLDINPTVGFKSIVINNKGIKDKQSAITDLTFHLINKGISHENETGRAPLPRLLQVWLDEENKGSDQLKIENIKERIGSQSIDKLFVGDFFAVDSKENYNIQIVDLFTSAVNRKIHSKTSDHIKDELADYILNMVNFDIESINTENTEIDKSVVFNLDYQKKACNNV